MVGVEFTGSDGQPEPDFARGVLRAAERRGLLLLPCGPYQNVVRLIPPLVVTPEQVDWAVEVFGEAVEEGNQGR
jgi:4-aminobutyrate aminotransferase